LLHVNVGLSAYFIKKRNMELQAAKRQHDGDGTGGQGDQTSFVLLKNRKKCAPHIKKINCVTFTVENSLNFWATL
jgi:hypothetical protein